MGCLTTICRVWPSSTSKMDPLKNFIQRNKQKLQAYYTTLTNTKIETKGLKRREGYDRLRGVDHPSLLVLDISSVVVL